MTEATLRQTAPSVGKSLPVAGLTALGVVFGDIGTSPLYTFKTILKLTGDQNDPAAVLGLLSLLVWTLLIVATIKYVAVAMRIDNDGEGGILALMSLLGLKRRPRPLIVAFGLFGAALIYGDGAVTPAISVLSAVEGLGTAAPAVTPYVLPIAVVILLGLFALQPLGTARIGKAFGPVMLLWFATLAVMGIGGLIRHPAVVVALDPLHAVVFLAHHGATGFLVLGGVFLCVTGAEALYADMGHFGARPIRLGWLAVVLPSLLLNYAGQAALTIDGSGGGAQRDGNVFYQLCPAPLLVPLVVLATIATVIASQSIITGAYSMTRQAIQLGWLPRLSIKQTSEEGYGQIYVGTVNWLLMIVTVALALNFRKSDNLASAYGLAVSATMLMTTVLLFIAMREIWGWGIAAAGTLAGLFLIVDTTFFAANIVKIAEGGYVPLLIAVVVYGLMWVWHRGATAVAARVSGGLEPVDRFLARLEHDGICRVPGTAVFMTRTATDVPPVLAWHVKHNRALHERVFILRFTVLSVPWLRNADRLDVHELAPGVWRGEARYGFMECPDIPALLADGIGQGCGLDLSDVTYYIGHETVLYRDEGLRRWPDVLFQAMERNAAHVGDVLRLPNDNVVEIGRRITL